MFRLQSLCFMIMANWRLRRSFHELHENSSGSFKIASTSLLTKDPCFAFFSSPSPPSRVYFILFFSASAASSFSQIETRKEQA